MLRATGVWVCPQDDCLWGVGDLFPMPQVFQECGSPQPTPARARRAPAPREEVSRLWSAAAAEERPATAAGSSLPQLVSRGRAWRGRGRGRGGGRALQLRPALSLRPGVGAPRAAEPSERLLGRAAPGGVRGPPHGGGPLAGGGALLDRSWAGPVRAGRQWQRRRRAGGRPRGRGGRLWGCSARRYLSPVVGGSQAQHLDNPELDAEASSPDLQTRRRRLKLRAATSRMKAAAQGRDLEQEDWGETPGAERGPRSSQLSVIGPRPNRNPAPCLL